MNSPVAARSWPLPARTDDGMVVPGIILAGILVLISLAAATVVSVVDVHRQVQAAADLAALAAAVAVQTVGDPCLAAASLAERNSAALLDCRIEGAEIAITVRRRLGVLGMQADVRARARAGPVAGRP